ncbi:hypothetical protein EDD18DRAFT_1196453 [Armillaria luteobubalina]|uniref:Uncharacterized protein n=1 Tax=Armillaria luteobubalina TaxID=153913 RepID=A0AA39PA70_9AGAR|nr:hypothetical protein EDD18DRAFT_1205844 [Armillaria luteobubalina]KAK0485459.1 hypothetical protein EDD18DRAFT_1196453 [Armillaria luteobubalina]
MIIAVRQITSGPTSTFSAAASEATDGASLGSSSSDGAAKSTLEWLFIALVCILVLSIISRSASRTRVAFLYFSSLHVCFSRISCCCTGIHITPQLSDIPMAYHPPTRARAAGVTQEDGGDKDVLPAYDKAGSPPKYVEIESTPIPPVDSERAPSVTINTGPRLGCETHTVGARS